MKLFYLVPALALAASACAVTPKSFYENPGKASDTALCRAFLETTDPTFRQATADEGNRRGLTIKQCQNKVAIENAAIIGIAAVATGVTVVAACQNGCGGGGYTPNYSDVDCAGGRGNGPHWQYGPINVGSYDPNGLDADGDGIGCEVSDVYQGS